MAAHLDICDQINRLIHDVRPIHERIRQIRVSAEGVLPEQQVAGKPLGVREDLAKKSVINGDAS